MQANKLSENRLFEQHSKQVRSMGKTTEVFLLYCYINQSTGGRHLIQSLMIIRDRSSGRDIHHLNLRNSGVR